MRKTLYLKFLLAYFIFGFFGFMVVATFVSSMTMEHLKREKADALYREATLIANTYASDLYNNETSLDTVKKQLDALDTYLSANLWIINPSGRMILDSQSPLDVETETVITDFDPTVTENTYYTIGNFFDSFLEEQLSVFAPITSDYKVRGYVVIHYPISSIETSCNSLLNISYLMLIILFLLSMIILIFAGIEIHVKICSAANHQIQKIKSCSGAQIQVWSNCKNAIGIKRSVRIIHIKVKYINLGSILIHDI